MTEHPYRKSAGRAKEPTPEQIAHNQKLDTAERHAQDFVKQLNMAPGPLRAVERLQYAKMSRTGHCFVAIECEYVDGSEPPFTVTMAVLR